MSICRICLATNVESSNNISANIMEFVNKIIPPLSSNLTLVCETCSEGFVTTYQFMNTAINTENKVLKEEQCLNVDIVNLSILHTQDKSLTNERYVCRICLKLISKPYIFLTQNSTNIMHHNIVRKMLEGCDIYLKYELTEKPVMCIDCWVALQTVYTFKKDYLDIRKKVIQFCKLQNYPLQNVNEEALTVMKQFLNEDLDIQDLPTSKSSIKCFTKIDDLFLLYLYYKISKFGLEIPNGHIHTIQEMWSKHRADESPPPSSFIMYRLNMMLHTDMLSCEEKEKVKADVRSKMNNDMKADSNNDQILDTGINKSGKCMPASITEQSLLELIIEEHSYSIRAKDIMKPSGEVTKNREHDSENTCSSLPFKCHKCNFGTFTTSWLERHLATNHKVDTASTHSCDIKERSYSDDEDQLLELIEPVMNLESDLDYLFDLDPHLPEADRPPAKLNLSSSGIEPPLCKIERLVYPADEYSSKWDGPLSGVDSSSPIADGPLSEMSEHLTEAAGHLIEANRSLSEEDNQFSKEYVLLSEEDANPSSLTLEQTLSTTEKAVEPLSMLNISKNNEKPVLRRVCCEEASKDHTITSTHEILLENAILTKHDKSILTMYNCYHCDFTSHHKNSLRRHIIAKHFEKSSIKKYSCDHCYFKTHYKSDLNKHVLAKHDKMAIKKYSCDQCDYQTHYKKDLNKHVLAKHDKMAIKKYGCDQCDFKTHYKRALNGHVLARHDKMTIKKYDCDQCDFKTHIKTHLNTHILAKHDKMAIKKYSCDQCDYKTHHKSDLNSHMSRKHKNFLKMYICYNCNFKTQYKKKLKSHIMAKHFEKSSIKLYGCDQCDYKAHYKSALNNHVLAKHDKIATKNATAIIVD